MGLKHPQKDPLLTSSTKKVYRKLHSQLSLKELPLYQVHIREEILEELAYFTANLTLEEILHADLMKKPSLALLFKRSSENLPNTIDDVVAQMAYGNSRQPPGDDGCPFQKLMLDLDPESGRKLVGIWAPTDRYSKAMGLKWLFPNVSGPFKMPDNPVIPPHVVMGYDAYKYKDAMGLNAKYPGSIMKYGFFTTDIPGDGQLIAKTVEKFENRTDLPTYEEKIVLQLAKVSEEAFDAFCELGPSYSSSSAVEGETESKWFFPEGYDVPEKTAKEVKKKLKKKSRVKQSVSEVPDEELAQEKEVNTESEPGEPEDEHEVLSDDENKEEEEEAEDAEEGADKATSPMESARTAE